MHTSTSLCFATFTCKGGGGVGVWSWLSLKVQRGSAARRFSEAPVSWSALEALQNENTDGTAWIYCMAHVFCRWGSETHSSSIISDFILEHWVWIWFRPKDPTGFFFSVNGSLHLATKNSHPAFPDAPPPHSKITIMLLSLQTEESSYSIGQILPSNWQGEHTESPGRQVITLTLLLNIQAFLLPTDIWVQNAVETSRMSRRRKGSMELDDADCPESLCPNIVSAPQLKKKKNNLNQSKDITD